MPAGRALRWDIFEEHLDEAAFLWEQWELALEAANYTLDEVAGGPEERLRAHLDALVLGGRPVAERLLLPALEGEPAQAWAAAWALLAAEDADHFDPVLAALASAEPPKTTALARALALSDHPAVPARLAALWTHAEPPLRAIILATLETREPTWAAAQSSLALSSGDPGLLLPALRLLRRIPARDPALLAHVEYAFAAPEPRVRAEAIATGALLGVRSAWEACRREASLPDTDRLPLALLALSPHPGDRQLLHQRVRDPAARRAALWALGFAGDLESADAAATWLGDEELGPLAAEVFSSITGLVIEGPFRAPGAPAGPGTGDLAADDAAPEVRPDDNLPAANPKAVDAWWRDQRGRWKPGQRYLAADPRGAEPVRAALATAAMWRRPVLAIELALETRAPVVVDVRQWARTQRRTLAAPARR
jgi:uncharacterized protein (TIGR02270 family)